MTESSQSRDSAGALTPASLSLTPADAATLEEAVRALHDSRGLLVRGADLVAGLIGQAATFGINRLSLTRRYAEKIQGLAEAALRRAFDVAILGIDHGSRLSSAGGARFVAATSGALGGLAGMAGFLPDATATTLLIMRNIATIAREEGEDLSQPEAREACLQVFAFGGPALGRLGTLSEEADTGYWSARLFLQGRPLVMLFSEVASRYGVRIGEKFAMQAIPLIGAAGGALVNTVFLDHYRRLAKVHFTIRRLERQYGTVAVQSLARTISDRIRYGNALPEDASAAA
ncbi:EcsC family protein [Granulibacter bethesdensis]|uniref:Protein ecsC n=1 Tax=Granulibacter bethesdensis TaxID=364410 RepID=A0AAN0VGB5_9PROT|nr:EcsC family protein [Granulibacter bethesdensis]AHJ63722.1 Protein ecsC [Granulibacter bethesdensis]AHJ68312.1 Protein ecsC [Granulibacter bethesdensis]